MSYKNIVGISAILFSTLAFATTTISKDQWLTAFKALAPSKMCRNLVNDPDTNNLLQKANISYDKCVTLIPASFEKCQKKYDSKLPEKIDKKNASIWGTKIGNCIGVDFFTNNLAGVSKSSPSLSATKTDKTPTKKGDEMTKEDWLDALTLVAPKLICDKLVSDKSLQKKLTQNGVTSEKCLSAIPDIIAACEKKLSSHIPSSLDKKNQNKWNQIIGKCIGKSFADQYLK